MNTKKKPPTKTKQKRGMEAYIMTTLHNGKCLRKILEAVIVVIPLNSNIVISFISFDQRL